MRHARRALIVAILLCFVLPQAASAAKPATRGFLPPGAGARGHSITELAAAWAVWAFGTGVGGPTLDGRCEQSPIDSKIWFLPVSVGGDAPVVCNVPQGSFLLVSPGGSECSNIEPEPYFGADPADLQACVDETFEFLTYIELTLDGRTVFANGLSPYILTTPTVNLPADNLLSSDPGISRFKAYFLVLHPMSKGTHSMRAYDEFNDGEFVGAVTYTINVGKGH